MQIGSGGKFMLQLILKKPKKIAGQLLYDLPSYFFLYRKEKQAFPKIKNSEVVRGQFDFQQMLETLAFQSDALDEIEFRKNFLASSRVVDGLSVDDVNHIVQVMVSNKLVDDKEIQRVVKVLNHYM